MDRQSTFTFEIDLMFLSRCLCPVVVEVVDGEVVADDGVSRNPDNLPKFDGFFTKIEEALEDDAFQLFVEYHATHGYPTFIFIEYQERMTDEEIEVCCLGD